MEILKIKNYCFDGRLLLFSSPVISLVCFHELMSTTRFWWSCTSCLPQDKQRSFALNDSWKDVISQSDVSLKIQQMKEMVWTFPQRRITNLYFGSKPIYLTCDSKDGSLWCQAIISSWRCGERRECCNQIGHNLVWAVRHHLSCCLFPLFFLENFIFLFGV